MGLSRSLGELLRGEPLEPLELAYWSPLDPGAFALPSARFPVTANSPSDTFVSVFCGCKAARDLNE